MIICKGCGAVLQDTDPSKEGFLPSLKPDSIYCKRCFRLIHYNEMPKIIASNADYEKVVNDLLKKNGLIVLLVDIFDFNATFNPQILAKLKGKDVLIVANKYDLLPKSTKVEKVLQFIERMSNSAGFSPVGINIISAKNSYYLDDLMNSIDLLRQDRDVYILGYANVGKSFLINSLLKRYLDKKEDVISTSPIPGTTLKSIAIHFFDDNKSFIDTPGLINEKNIYSKLMPQSYPKLMPKSEIRPITFQLNSDNLLFVSGLISVQVLDQDNVGMTCFFSKDLVLHRRKVEGSNEFFKNHLGELLNPPMIEEKDNLEYVTKDLVLNKPYKQDLYIYGLGFISFNKNCKIRVKYIKGIDVILRYALLGN